MLACLRRLSLYKREERLLFNLHIVNRAIGDILNLEETFLIVKENGSVKYQES